jgi:putative FmdB family regulatory protein
MPLFDYECTSCQEVSEQMQSGDCEVSVCSKCGASARKLPSCASIKIKGLRAANGYGLKFIDTPGKSKITGEESGYSYNGQDRSRGLQSDVTGTVE